MVAHFLLALNCNCVKCASDEFCVQTPHPHYSLFPCYLMNAETDTNVQCVVHGIQQPCPEKEELEPWLVKEMDKLLSEVWLTGNEDLFQQIFHFILSENVSGNSYCNILLPVKVVFSFGVLACTVLLCSPYELECF